MLAGGDFPSPANASSTVTDARLLPVNDNGSCDKPSQEPTKAPTPAPTVPSVTTPLTPTPTQLSTPEPGGEFPPCVCPLEFAVTLSFDLSDATPIGAIGPQVGAAADAYIISIAQAMGANAAYTRKYLNCRDFVA